MKKKMYPFIIALVVIALLGLSKDVYAQNEEAHSQGYLHLEAILRLRELYPDTQDYYSWVHFQVLADESGFTTRIRMREDATATGVAIHLWELTGVEPLIHPLGPRNRYYYTENRYDYLPGEAPLDSDDLNELGVAAGIPAMKFIAMNSDMDRNWWYPSLDYPPYRYTRPGGEEEVDYWVLPEGETLQDQLESVPVSQIFPELESFSPGVSLPPLELPVAVTVEPGKGITLLPPAGVTVTSTPLWPLAGLGSVLVLVLGIGFFVYVRNRAKYG